MVRPEGFEPPTLWFEAKCSIQLSYGRGVVRIAFRSVLQEGTGLQPICVRCSASCGGGRCGLGRWGRRCGEHDALNDVDAGAAQELVDDGLGEAAGVVLDADGALTLIELEVADAVDLANAGQGKHGALGGRDAVAIEDVKLSHS